MHDAHPTVPFGFCHCGCGRKTKLAVRTDAHAGCVKGQPRWFLRGHRPPKPPTVARLAAIERHKAGWALRGMPYGLCLCGCGVATNISLKYDQAKGYLPGEPYRFLGGHNRIDLRWLPEDRGYKTPCHIWQLHIRKDGYGADGSGLAHRTRWIRERGPIPEGLEIDHLCRVRACCNPDHLEPVTPVVNVRRGANTKLTKDQVAAIRAARGRMRQADIGARFSITQGMVSQIQRRAAWAED